jgi:SAM-dependent methyltransferase
LCAGRINWDLQYDSHAAELAHHEALYKGFAQKHFAKAAVRELRRHLLRRILEVTGAGKDSRIVSLGCGIGDTELLLAKHVGFVTGLDLSPAAIRQARADAARLGIANVEFCEGDALRFAFGEASFDAAIGIFFLHHVPDAETPAVIERIRRWLRPGGVFYGLDPNRFRLSGALGRLLVPRLMRRYQTPGERELKPRETANRFEAAGFQAHSHCYDFASTPLAGLLPAWGWGYRAARRLDEALIRIPLTSPIGSNFELIARK